jgi:hypothetical protein
MWEFLTEIFKTHGLLALVEVVQCVLIIYLFKQIKTKDLQLLTLSEKRLEDVMEEREEYQELATSIERSIDLLIKVLKKNGN